MAYERLNFEQYFIDQSLGLWGGVPEVEVNYKYIEFEHRGHLHNGYYCVMYNEKRDVHQIYFKETCTDEQWRTNFEFPGKYYDSFEYEGKKIQLKVASGWGELYQHMKWPVRNELTALIEQHGEKEVEVIGWSLGSAMAQLCAQDIFYNFNIKAHVFTYGSVKPWYGFSRATKNYLRSCYKECYNFGDHNDVVTYMVPLPGYFKFRKVKLKQDRFCIAKLFNPMKYHTEYYKSEYYENIE